MIWGDDMLRWKYLIKISKSLSYTVGIEVIKELKYRRDQEEVLKSVICKVLDLPVNISDVELIPVVGRIYGKVINQRFYFPSLRRLDVVFRVLLLTISCFYFSSTNMLLERECV